MLVYAVRLLVQSEGKAIWLKVKITNSSNKILSTVSLHVYLEPARDAFSLTSSSSNRSGSDGSITCSVSDRVACTQRCSNTTGISA